jgi:hypothetical protein
MLIHLINPQEDIMQKFNENGQIVYTVTAKELKDYSSDQKFKCLDFIQDNEALAMQEPSVVHEIGTEKCLYNMYFEESDEGFATNNRFQLV